jgi:hypothetical protein
MLEKKLLVIIESVIFVEIWLVEEDGPTAG